MRLRARLGDSLLVTGTCWALWSFGMPWPLIAAGLATGMVLGVALHALLPRHTPQPER